MTITEVQTVLGPVPAADLGHTQFHEHLLIDLTLNKKLGHVTAEEKDGSRITLENYYKTRREHPPVNLCLLDRDVAVKELELYTASGGRTIVDATPIGIGRDPEGLREIAERSGVNVIMGCGFYYRDYHPPYVESASTVSLADIIINDLTVGADGTGIRAGVIGEIGLMWPLHPDEERVLRAAAFAQRETGAGLLIHPGHSVKAPFQVMDIIESAGGELDRVVMGHLDRTMFRTEDLLALAATGCYLEFDLFGQEMSFYPVGNTDAGYPVAGLEKPVDMPNDATRVDYICDLVDAGYLDRVIIAQDMCNKTSLRTYGGEGYSHILDHVIPLMRRKGLSDEQIRVITVDNPRNALTGGAAATTTSPSRARSTEKEPAR